MTMPNSDPFTPRRFTREISITSGLIHIVVRRMFAAYIALNRLAKIDSDSIDCWAPSGFRVLAKDAITFIEKTDGKMLARVGALKMNLIVGVRKSLRFPMIANFTIGPEVIAWGDKGVVAFIVYYTLLHENIASLSYNRLWQSSIPADRKAREATMEWLSTRDFPEPLISSFRV